MDILHQWVYGYDGIAKDSATLLTAAIPVYENDMPGWIDPIEAPLSVILL